MKPEQQRIAIAEIHLGLLPIRGERISDCGHLIMLSHDGANTAFCHDYLNDLNAIIEAVRSLPKDRLVYVLRFLQIIVTDDPENSMNEKALATPQQWSEAFLRGVGRWEE